MLLVKARVVAKKAWGFATNGAGCRLGGRGVPLVRVQGFSGEVNVLPKGHGLPLVKAHGFTGEGAGDHW